MTQLASRSVVDIYVIATLGGLDRAVAEVTLSEPRVRDEAHAARVIACVTETLAGLAIGSTVGAVADAVRKTFGVRPLVRADIVPPPRVPHWLEDARTTTPVAELKHGLRRRIALAHRDAIGMISGIEAQVTERAAWYRMLGLLARDEMVAERYAPHVIAGWRCAAAAIEGRAIPAVDPLWQRWAQRLRGERPVVTETSDRFAGAIMQIG